MINLMVFLSPLLKMMKMRIAHFIEIPNISAFGQTPEEALTELEVAWEGVKESCRKHGDAIPMVPSQKEYSGQFNLRIDKRMHRKLAVEAARERATQ